MQGLDQIGLRIAPNLKHDLLNNWQRFKMNSIIDLTIDKSRLPYMVQPFDTVELERVMFLAKIKNNPAAFTININGVPIPLARVD